MQIMPEPLSSDPCARLKIQIPMHSISWGCTKIVRHSDPISLLISTFGIHLEPGWKSWVKSFIIALLKNVQRASDSFALVLDESLHLDPEGISCSLTCGSHTVIPAGIDDKRYTVGDITVTKSWVVPLAATFHIGLDMVISGERKGLVFQCF